MKISSVGRIFSQCIHILNHHTVYFKYLTIFVNYASIKLEEKQKLEEEFGTRVGKYIL